MKLSRFYFITLPLSFISTCSFAFFCPSNFSQIDIGYTIDQVTQLCGKPDKQETKDDDESGPQEWNYYLPQPASSYSQQADARGTLKTSMAFDADGKITNITVNGIGVGKKDMCGRSISLGDTRDDVKSACGSPEFVNKQGQSGSPSSTTGSSSGTTGSKSANKITTFTYNSTPPVTLIFKNGVLTGK